MSHVNRTKISDGGKRGRNGLSPGPRGPAGRVWLVLVTLDYRVQLPPPDGG
jgi:hypothetical protein